MLRETAIHFDGTLRLPEHHALQARALAARSAVDAQIDRLRLDLGAVRKVNLVIFMDSRDRIDGSIAFDGPIASMYKHISGLDDLAVIAGLTVSKLAALLIDSIRKVADRQLAVRTELDLLEEEARNSGFRTVVAQTRQHKNRKLIGTFKGVIDETRSTQRLQISSIASGAILHEESKSIMCDYWDMKAYARLLRWEGLRLVIRTKPGSSALSLAWGLDADTLD